MEIAEIHVDDFEKVVRCHDPHSGLHAIIAVHDTTLGPALGGMRMLPYASEDEALFDVLRLARGMTFKSAVAETGLGGGKSVIIGDPEVQKCEALFLAMGRFVESLGGKYITAEDMNIGIPDLEIVRRETRWVTGLSRESGSSGNPSPYTARGCLRGMQAVLEHSFQRKTFDGARVLIQGVGAVGGRLAEMVQESGGHPIICDLNQKRVAELAAKHGYEVVDNEQYLDVECDIFSPCARGAGLNDETIPRLKCKAVAGCANNQLLEPRHAEDLFHRGILYAPDYVINAGGIINVSVELLPGGYREDVALSRIDRIHDILKRIFEVSDREQISTREAAARIAEARIEEARAARANGKNKSPGKKS
jgi:leucine dehydrogenase